MGIVKWLFNCWYTTTTFEIANKKTVLFFSRLRYAEDYYVLGIKYTRNVCLSRKMWELYA